MTLLAQQTVDCADHAAVGIENDPNALLLTGGEHVPFGLQAGFESLHGAGDRPQIGNGRLSLRQVHALTFGTLACIGGHGRSGLLGILSECLDQPSAHKRQVPLREKLERGLMVAAQRRRFAKFKFADSGNTFGADFRAAILQCPTVGVHVGEHKVGMDRCAFNSAFLSVTNDGIDALAVRIEF